MHFNVRSSRITISYKDLSNITKDCSMNRNIHINKLKSVERGVFSSHCINNDPLIDWEHSFIWTKKIIVVNVAYRKRYYKKYSIRFKFMHRHWEVIWFIWYYYNMFIFVFVFLFVMWPSPFVTIWYSARIKNWLKVHIRLQVFSIIYIQDSTFLS